ncbi:ribonuclease H-like domain-containing protein [Crassisporium funariophilum]|nr:ribonuclease H-like domain-containing protein [Crassisporium funariophilum]
MSSRSNIGSRPVAMDCEWRVFFRKSRGVGSSASRERRVAVVQVADTRGMILVIQVYAMGRFPIRLIDLLENSKVAKFGVNILNDGNKLFRDYGILSNNLVELGALALVADPSGTERSKTKRKIVSLAKLVQWYCSKTLEKGDERTSNWEMELSKQQLHYAANDVHSSLVVYKNMCDLARIHEIDLDKQSNLFTSSVSWPAPAPTPAPTPTHADSQPSDTPTSQVPAKKYMHPQHLRAYNFWHIQHMSMHDMCLKLSLKAQYPHLQTHIQTQTQTQDIRLKPSTVISYIVGALQADPALEWNVDELRKLLQMEAGSWVRHRDWVLSRGLQIPSSV